jgi:hypothetical protein
MKLWYDHMDNALLFCSNVDVWATLCSPKRHSSPQKHKLGWHHKSTFQNSIMGIRNAGDVQKNSPQLFMCWIHHFSDNYEITCLPARANKLNLPSSTGSCQKSKPECHASYLFFGSKSHDQNIQVKHASEAFPELISFRNFGT